MQEESEATQKMWKASISKLVIESRQKASCRNKESCYRGNKASRVISHEFGLLEPLRYRGNKEYRREQVVKDAVAHEKCIC